MNIVVLCKQVPDTYSERRLRGDGALDRDASDAVLDEINERAVEEALVLKEAHGGAVTVVSMGPDRATEAIRKAQELAGTPEVNAEQVRAGFEALDITEARMAELGLPDFGQPIKLSCANHGGDGHARIQQWDATAKKWTLISDWIAPDAEVLDPLIAEDSEAYVKEAGITPRCN